MKGTQEPLDERIAKALINRRVVIAEDDNAIAHSTTRVFTRFSALVTVFNQADAFRDAIPELAAVPGTLYLTDNGFKYSGEGDCGEKNIAALLKHGVPAETITAYSAAPPEKYLTYLHAKNIPCVQKPFENSELVRTVGRSLVN